MHLCDRINSGMLFYEHGHTDPIDIQQEKQLQEERDHCKEMMFEYNNTHPREDALRQTIMRSILGSCGEHGGDPTSVEFCHKIGLDYVSCSPFRVPIARLAAAQAAINASK